MNVRVLRTIRDIDPVAWDALCPDIVFSHAWFRALEDSRAVNVEPRHLVLEEHGRIVGVLPCMIQRGDPYYTLADRLFGPLARLAAALGLRVLPALLAYSPLAHRTELFLAPGTDRTTALRAIRDAMDAVCRDERLPVSGWLFASESHEALRAAGYHSVYLCPIASWRNAYRSFDQFLEHLRRISRRRYKMVRHELNQFAPSGIRLTEEPLNSLSDARLAAMHAAHYARYRAQQGQALPPAFFAALKRDLGDCAVLHVARTQEQVVGYSIILKQADRWHMFLSGEAAVDSHRNKLHFHLNYYYPMRLAIDQSIRRLDYGTASYQTKLERGCQLEPLRMGLRFHTPSLRLVMPVWLCLVDSWHRWKYRRERRMESTRAPVALRGPWWQRAANRLAEYRTFVLISHETATPVRLPSLPPDAQIRLLSESEDVWLRPTVTATNWRIFQTFRQAGYRCYGAWVGGTLAGYLWATTGRRHFGGYFGVIPLRDDEAFTGYVYVWPPFRGLGLAQALKERFRQDAAASGVRTIYWGIVDTNTASLKSAARVGALPLARWRYVRLGPWAWRRAIPIQHDHPLAKLFVSERQRTGYLPHRAAAVGDPALWQRQPRGRPDASWTLADPMWKQLAAAWRANGPRWILRRAARRLLAAVWEQVVTFECDAPIGPERLILSPVISSNPELRWLSPDELPRLAEVASPAMRRRFAQFAAQGGRCYAALLEGRVVAYNWYIDRPYHSPVTRLTHDVGAGEMFLIYSHTVRGWRGRGIDVAMKAAAFSEFQRAGYHTVRTTIDDDNRNSLRLMARWAAVPHRRYRYTRILGWRRVRAESLIPTKELFEQLVGRPPRPYNRLRAFANAQENSS